MKHAETVRATRTLLMLSACGGSPQPSAPPEPVDALTTSAATRSPEVSPDTESATSAGESSRAPTLPTEVTRQNEDGAAAFTAHYFDLVSYLGQSPEAGVIDDLAANGCAACSNYEENIDYLIANDAASSGPSLEIGTPQASVVQDAAIVSIALTQNAYTNVDSSGTDIDMFEESGTRAATVELR